jgi:hypothetical protein
VWIETYNKNPLAYLFWVEWRRSLIKNSLKYKSTYEIIGGKKGIIVVFCNSLP